MHDPTAPDTAAQAASTKRTRRRKAAEDPAAEPPPAYAGAGPAGAAVFDPPSEAAPDPYQHGRADHGEGMPRSQHPFGYSGEQIDEWLRGWDEAAAALPPAADAAPDPLDALAEDPAQAAAPADASELPAEVLVQIRGLWANGREIAAIRLYRDSVSPSPDLAEAKRVVEALVAEGEAPADFVLPEGGPAQEAAAEPAPDVVLEDAPLLEGGEVPEARREPPPRRTGRHEITRRTQDRAVPLSDDEFERKAHELAVMQDKITEMEARHAAEKKAMREEKAALEGQRSALALVVRDKVEVRSVEVITEADYDAGVAYEIDAATGRVLARRAISSAEAQVPLFGAGPQAPARPAAPTPDEAPGESWPDEPGAGADGDPPEDDEDEDTTDPDSEPADPDEE